MNRLLFYTFFFTVKWNVIPYKILQITVIATNPNNPNTDGDSFALDGSDPYPLDYDNDGLSDEDELEIYGTDPNNPNTDGDEFTLDGSDPYPLDYDNDGIPDTIDN